MASEMCGRQPWIQQRVSWLVKPDSEFFEFHFDEQLLSLLEDMGFLELQEDDLLAMVCEQDIRDKDYAEIQAIFDNATAYQKFSIDIIRHARPEERRFFEVR